MLIPCSYLVFMPFLKPVSNINMFKIIEVFGDYLLYAAVAQLVLVTLFSYIGGIIGCVAYMIVMFIVMLDANYCEFD